MIKQQQQQLLSGRQICRALGISQSSLSTNAPASAIKDVVMEASRLGGFTPEHLEKIAYYYGHQALKISSRARILYQNLRGHKHDNYKVETAIIGYVYIMISSNGFKLGYTTDPDTRFNTINRFPGDILEYFYFEGTLHMEQHIHKRYKGIHRNEWYPNEYLIEVTAMMCKVCNVSKPLTRYYLDLVKDY